MIQLNRDIHSFRYFLMTMCISIVITYVKAEVILCVTNHVLRPVYKVAS
jgi:hypothetical protein